ncbi:hypothetical protein A0H81_03129 [Grifola frondosa]|uniref:Uncharacterized protein n=1 Tax=Grifola frondosa TaxID=5627 RepID=A0A1C7MIH0_GRIFR|nr:hypothetical protein A0H81_03129 [Grifola frondosa]
MEVFLESKFRPQYREVSIHLRYVFHGVAKSRNQARRLGVGYGHPLKGTWQKAELECIESYATLKHRCPKHYNILLWNAAETPSSSPLYHYREMTYLRHRGPHEWHNVISVRKSSEIPIKLGAGIHNICCPSRELCIAAQGITATRRCISVYIRHIGHDIASVWCAAQVRACTTLDKDCV